MDKSHTNERRLLQRLQRHTLGPVELTVEALGLTVQAMVRDMSVRGLGLLTAEPLAVGTALTLRRCEARRPFSPPMTVEVRQSTELPDGSWLLGCTLSRVLTADDMLDYG